MYVTLEASVRPSAGRRPAIGRVLFEVLQPCQSSGGHDIGQVASTRDGPTKEQSLPFKSCEVAVKRAAIRPWIELEKDIIRLKKPSALCKDHQDLCFRHRNTNSENIVKVKNRAFQRFAYASV